MDAGDDPEDILLDSLQTLYDLQPITLSSPGSLFTYKYSGSGSSFVITLQTPDTHSANWALHASSIWVSSIYLSDHWNELGLEKHIKELPTNETLRVLELGASAGLPSILIAKLFPERVLVTASDYPDEELIKTLAGNIERNGVNSRCRAVPYAWGSDVSSLHSKDDDGGFDVILAADTLWNPDLHSIFIDTLKMALKKSLSSRIHLVAGLHTGRYTIQSFLESAQNAGFVIESVVENEVSGSAMRRWRVTGDDDEKERRRWVVWAKLKLGTVTK